MWILLQITRRRSDLNNAPSGFQSVGNTKSTPRLGPFAPTSVIEESRVFSDLLWCYRRTESRMGHYSGVRSPITRGAGSDLARNASRRQGYGKVELDQGRLPRRGRWPSRNVAREIMSAQGKNFAVFGFRAVTKPTVAITVMDNQITKRHEDLDLGIQLLFAFDQSWRHLLGSIK
jgi:hypothetical protein